MEERSTPHVKTLLPPRRNEISSIAILPFKNKTAVYRVKWGDSLYEIASKVFRDGKRWTIIYDSNKREIMNIKDLPVGQVIIVPLTVPQSDSFKRDI